MTAPAKIYLQACGDCNDNDCKSCKFEDLGGNATWCKDKIFDKDICYICKDTLLEIIKTARAAAVVQRNFNNRPLEQEARIDAYDYIKKKIESL